MRPSLFRSCCLATEARSEVSGRKIKKNQTNPQKNVEKCVSEFKND